MTFAGALLISYLFGSFEASYIYGKLFKKIDIRDYGSKNPGATNAIRVFGTAPGLLCLLADALKGMLAIIVVKQLFNCSEPLLLLASGLAVIIGHNHPFYMGFKGGKGVAATLGVILLLDWRVFLAAGIPALLILLLTRIMSLASLSFELGFFIRVVIFYGNCDNLPALSLLAFLYPLISFIRHRENIKRLLHGKEPRLGEKDKTEKAE